MQKTNEREFAVVKLYVKLKGYDNSFIAGLTKKILLYKMCYFLVSCTRSKNKIKVEWDISNYATKSDLKSATGGDASEFAMS